ncbi:hypothetical protein D3C87_966410 [compost metagenome]
MRGQRLCCADRQVTDRAQLAIGHDASANQAACAAVEGPCRDAVVALRRDDARVDDGAIGVQSLVTGCVQASSVVQASQCRVQVGAGKHVACGIVQVRHIQGGVAGHGLQLALGIVDIATGQLQMTPCRHRAIRVVQAAHVQCGILRRHDTARVVQQYLGFDQRIAIAFDLATRVVQQAGSIDAHQAVARLRQAAGTVIQAAGVDGHLIRHRRRIAVIEGDCHDVELAIARDLAELVVELARVDGQHADSGVLQLAIDVRQHRRIQGQVSAVDGDAARRVVEFARGDDGVARARLHDLAAGVVQVGHVQLQLTGYQLALAVHQRLGIGRIGRDG